MSIQELYNALVATGFPISYQEFKEEQTPPYIAYFVDEVDSITADGVAVVTVSDVEVHLITAKARNRTQETLVESALKSVKCGWIKNLDWDTTQKIYDVIYSFQVVEGEEEDE